MLYGLLIKGVDIADYYNRTFSIRWIRNSGIADYFLQYMTLQKNWGRKVVLDYLYPKSQEVDMVLMQECVNELKDYLGESNLHSGFKVDPLIK